MGFVDKMVGSTISRKKDSTLNMELFGKFCDAYTALNTAKTKALYVSILGSHKHFRDYSEKLKNLMRSTDKEIFERHIKIHITPYRVKIMDGGSDFIIGAVIDILLYESDFKDFGIMLALVGKVFGENATKDILGRKEIQVSPEQLEKIMNTYENTF